jgi:Ulp1 family protease
VSDDGGGAGGGGAHGSRSAPISLDSDDDDDDDSELLGQVASSSSSSSNKNSSSSASDDADARRRRHRRSARLAASSASDSVEFVRFPTTGTGVVDTITIKQGDLLRLREGQQLNDSLIDFYLKFVHRQLPQQRHDATHCFNSFLFTRWHQAVVAARNGGVVPFAAVRSWIKRVQIFAKDYLYIPINVSEHWLLAVVCFAGRVLQKRGGSSSSSTKLKRRRRSQSSSNESKQGGGSGAGGSGQTPCILLFDSLHSASARTTHDRIAQLVRRFLNACCRNGAAAVKQTRPFSKVSMPNILVKVPQQRNDVDCGLYLLQYAELFAQAPFADLREPAVHRPRWFSLSVIDRKRVQILDLLRSIAANAAIEEAAAAVTAVAGNGGSSKKRRRDQDDNKDNDATTTTKAKRRRRR